MSEESELKLEHGKYYKRIIIHGLEYSAVRYCAVCQNGVHGHLYDCEHYPDELREEIRLAVDSCRRKLKTLKNDTDIDWQAIEITKLFFGI